jgi:8-oxo-dGTP pyrophosphatase MutT (NUDIX family)
MAWQEPKIWYANLATFYAATGALITDPTGRVLLVKPNYRPHWTLPGGMIEATETPSEALARELDEELALQITIGPLLLVDWAPPAGDRPRPIIYFLFDAGTITDTTGLILQPDEIDDVQLFAPDDARTALAPHVAHRLPAALAARTAGPSTKSAWIADR